MRDKQIRDILIDWKKEARETHLMQYHFRGGVLTIYTDRPGPLIGRCGALVEKYSKRLKDAHLMQELVIKETTGIF